ncbi:hypothetical protein ACFQT0_19410 [Hymenobacter humi]|uniref:Uncharacterized protein n=1 Tax=Hymenobacter humi TaxID=1411620 RepID=A0ABW2UA42_9BACT
MHNPIQHAGSRLEWLAILTGFPLIVLTGLPADVLAQLLPLVNFLTSEDHLLTARCCPPCASRVGTAPSPPPPGTARAPT